jgi:predicted transcriptional regulator
MNFKEIEQKINPELIYSSLLNCSKKQLKIIRYLLEHKRGTRVKSLQKMFALSGSSINNILVELCQLDKNKRLDVPLVERFPKGPNGAYLYFIKEQVTLEKLEEVEKIINKQEFNKENKKSLRENNNNQLKDLTYLSFLEIENKINQINNRLSILEQYILKSKL